MQNSIRIGPPSRRRQPAIGSEFAKHKITVNAFAPGVVVTPLWDGLEQDMIDKGVIKKKGEFIESFSASILLGYPSKPADLAGIAAFLASSDSDYITGQVIMSDGGMVLGLTCSASRRLRAGGRREPRRERGDARPKKSRIGARPKPERCAARDEGAASA